MVAFSRGSPIGALAVVQPQAAAVGS